MTRSAAQHRTVNGDLHLCNVSSLVPGIMF